MPKAAVIHHTLNSPGGESTVAIETIESLYELGYEVELVTVQPPDLDGISKSYGKKIHIATIKSLLPFKLNYFGFHQWILRILMLLSIHMEMLCLIGFQAMCHISCTFTFQHF